MTFELRYELGPSSYLAHRKRSERAGLRTFRNGFLSWCGLVAGVSLLGVATAVMAQSLVLSVMFVAVLLAIAFEAATYRRRFDALVAKEVARLPVRAVTLRVDDSGLRETVAGVESFAPWSAVKSYTTSPDAVALELASGSWSLIPTSAFGTATGSSLTAFLSVLQQRGIPARTQ